MNEKQLSLLGLSRVEARVIEALSFDQLNVSGISRKINVPKTTLNYVVRKLKARGLIIAIPHGKRKLWALRNPNQLRDQLVAIGENFSSGKESGITTIPISKNTRIEIYRGAESLYRLWQRFTSLSKLERLYAIQPDKSFNSAVKHIIKNLSYETLVAVNEKIKTSKVVVEAIVHEHSAETIPETISSVGHDPQQFLSGFVGRLADTVKLPRDFMDVSAEMYIHDDTFTIIHWDDEVAVSITNKAVVSFFKEMFESLKYFCNKYDQNDRIAKKMVELSLK